MSSREVLAALGRADLARLGFRQEDAAACRDLIDGLAHDPQRLARVTDLAEILGARIGRFFDDDLPVRDAGGLAAFDEGLTTLLALVSIAEEVHAAYLRRGLPDEVAWASLADLGQQVHIFRSVFGFFGLYAQTWCVANFTGRHLWLGRLQFTLERADSGEVVVGIHIPESGPLLPVAVDASLAWARDLVPRLYPEFTSTGFHLTSWLLDPLIVAGLAPDSNLARFAARFQVIDDGEAGPHDALFFVFHRELSLQPVDFSALPRDSSLRRAVLAAPLERLSVPTGRLVD
ncbi:MAG: acyltransferase domain-containing protein [Propionibacteriaceae bacterium]|nr:acyltransferase domain-containing protein [Propionibacteriaceae bacterium]